MSTLQFHPVVAVGIPITPLVAVPPVPTLTRKAAVPLFAEMDGLVPNPEEIVGAAFERSRFVSVIVVNLAVPGVVLPIAPGAAKVAPFKDEALKFATFVVLVTVNGAVPVACVLVTVVNRPVVAVVAPMDVLLIVLAAVGLIVNAPAGLIVTVPVPVGEMAIFALAGDSVTAPDADNVVKLPAAAAVPPMAGGDAK